MNFWATASGTNISDDILKLIQEHHDTTLRIVKTFEETVRYNVIKDVTDTLTSTNNSDKTKIVLDQDEQYKIYEANSKFAEWADQQIDNVRNLFETGAPSTLEELFESRQLVLYSLKLARIGVAAIAVAVAERLFQSLYRKRVYNYSEEPPSLLWFLGLVILIDLAIHAIVAVILSVVMFVFSSHENAFPIDRDMMRLWAFDYIIALVPISLILISTAMVLTFKKYFRYKYEGERAIRAMAKITFYTYAVIMPIPFYRLTYG
jgi:hypothetical protein